MAKTKSNPHQTSKRPKSYANNHILLLEGFGDVAFFTQFFKHHLAESIIEKLVFDDEPVASVRDRILMEKHVGEPNLFKYLTETLNTTGFSFTLPKSLFVIIDRDGKENRFTDYQTLFKNSLYNIDIPEVNQVVPCVIENQTVAFGIFMIGDETTPYQYLEGLLYETRREKGVSHEQLAEQCVALLPADSQSVDKSKVAVYLASLPKWSNTLGFALEKEWIDASGKKHLGYFDIEHSAFDFLNPLLGYLNAPTP
jgi:hypothetical protein